MRGKLTKRSGFRPARSAKCCWVCLGQPVSPATVSRVAQNLDAAVAAFHTRQLKGPNKALILDGVVLARKTGAGAFRRSVLVALVLRVGIPRGPQATETGPVRPHRFVDRSSVSRGSQLKVPQFWK
jgi:hypothetical protein